MIWGYHYFWKHPYISYNKIWVLFRLQHFGCFLGVSLHFVSFLNFFPLGFSLCVCNQPVFRYVFFGGPQLHGVLWQVVLRIVARDEVQNLGIVPIFFQKKINITSRSASLPRGHLYETNPNFTKKNKKTAGTQSHEGGRKMMFLFKVIFR